MESIARAWLYGQLYSSLPTGITVEGATPKGEGKLVDRRVECADHSSYKRDLWILPTTRPDLLILEGLQRFVIQFQIGIPLFPD